MEQYFKNQIHQERFLSVITEDQMCSSDRERASLFYLLTGNEELYQKRKYIYDTKEHRIVPCFSRHDVDFSSGISALIRLGFNLYNNFTDADTSPLIILSGLDEENLTLAEWAIKIRLRPEILLRILS